MERDDPESNGDIQRIFHSGHGDLNSHICQFCQFIRYAINLIADNQAHRFVRYKIIIRNTRIGLLKQENLVTPGLVLTDNIRDIRGIFPGHAFLGTQRGLGDPALRRITGNAAQPEFFNPRAVGAAEDRPDIVQAADIVEHG